MLTETLKILKKYGIKLDKRKGQNYLIDNDVLSQIITCAELSEGDTVLEIGAGIGTLTIPLAKNAGKVIAIEQSPTPSTHRSTSRCRRSPAHPSPRASSRTSTPTARRSSPTSVTSSSVPRRGRSTRRRSRSTAMRRPPSG